MTRTSQDTETARSVDQAEMPRSLGEQVVSVVVPARHLYKVPEAMRLLSMSRSVIYEQMRAGRLRFVKQGRATLIPAVAIQEYVQTLLDESEVC